MAAMAYTTATVNNDASVKLTNTSQALLSLSPSPIHNASYLKKTTAHLLIIDLSKGYNNDTFGVQPFSVYTWEDLFKVKNNSENTVKVSIELDPKAQGRIKVSAKADDKWVLLSGIHSNGSVLSFTLAPNAEQWVSMKTDSLNGHVTTLNYNLIVSAEAQSSTLN